MSDAPNKAWVFVVSFVTALITAIFTVLIMFRLQLLPSVGETSGVNVPNLSGLTQGDAQINLESQGLILMIGGRKVTPNAQAGTVVSQSPFAGTKVQKGSTVTVVLAGEAPAVPDVKGRTITEATLLLEQVGFKLQVGPAVSDDTIPKDRIVSQVPPAGAFLEPGRTVMVQASDGPASATVPKLTFTSLNKAKKLIQDAGFKIGEIKWVYNEEWDPYTVLGQTPAEGEKAKLGSTIDLTANPE